MNTIQYTCSMHPEVVKDGAGMCPKCGMNLVPTRDTKKRDENSHEHDKHTGHKTDSFLKKFWVALVLTIPIFFYSEMAKTVFKVQASEFPALKYALLSLGSIVFFYCGWIFLASAYRELRAKLPGMMTLIAIAIIAAYLYSFFSILFGTGHDLLFELSSLIAIS